MGNHDLRDPAETTYWKIVEEMEDTYIRAYNDKLLININSLNTVNNITSLNTVNTGSDETNQHWDEAIRNRFTDVTMFDDRATTNLPTNIFRDCSTPSQILDYIFHASPFLPLQ